MTTKITAPSKYTGATYIGPTILDFTEGVASTDVQLNAGTRKYLEKHGYTVESGDDGPFDPSKHNQDDVLAHLQGLTDVDERQRILAAEATREKGTRQKIAAYAEELAAQGGTGGDGDPGDGAEGQGDPDGQGGGDA